MTRPMQMPQDIEAEQALLGALLIDPEAILRVATFLRPEDFYVRKNGWVYEAILALHERREPVDFVTLHKELEARGHLEEIGGPAYIAQLMDIVPTALHAEEYARLVEEAAIRRRVIDFASRAVKVACDQNKPLEEVLTGIEQGALALRRLSGNQPVPVSEVVSAVYDALTRASQEGRAIGLPTGFSDLDELLGGFRPGNLVVVGARTGQGKSSLLLSFARAAVENGVPTLMFSLEMSAEEIVHRLITAETGIPTTRIQCARIGESDWHPIADAAGRVSAMTLWIDDSPALSIAEIRARARRLHAEYGIGLVLVDYIQLATPTRRHDSRYLDIGEISQGLKALAKELQIPVIAASQLSRSVEQRADKRPTLADLRESGNQEQDSDVVLFIHREGGDGNNLQAVQAVTLIVAKNRHGPTGDVSLLWLRERMMFAQIARNEVSNEI
jgi:replicative DNA helicase